MQNIYKLKGFKIKSFSFNFNFNFYNNYNLFL